MSQSRCIVVVGATGNQGGAVTRALVARGHRVRALVRSPDSQAARMLRSAGVELVVGNLEEPPSLDSALEGAEAVFGVTTPFEGVAAETHKGIALVDAARRARITHMIYTSAGNADRRTGVPSFETKLRVEEYLRASGVPFTIVAPVYFMENLLTPFSLSRLRQGEYARWMPLERKLQMIAVDDVGRFCARIFEQREAFLGRRIDIAGDELDAWQVASVFSHLLRREIRPVALPVDGVPADGDQGRNIVALLRWLASTGFSANLQALRREFPEVGWQTLEQWVRQQDWGFASVEGGAAPPEA